MQQKMIRQEKGQGREINLQICQAINFSTGNQQDKHYNQKKFSLIKLI